MLKLLKVLLRALWIPWGIGAYFIGAMWIGEVTPTPTSDELYRLNILKIVGSIILIIAFFSLRVIGKAVSEYWRPQTREGTTKLVASIVSLIVVVLVGIAVISYIRPDSDVKVCRNSAEGSGDYESTLEILQTFNSDQILTEEKIEELAQNFADGPETRRQDYSDCMMRKGWKCYAVADSIIGTELDKIYVLALQDGGWQNPEQWSCRSSTGEIVPDPFP